MPAPDKCYWVPCQIGEWLGLLINTVLMEFQVLPKKHDKAIKLINNNLSSFLTVSVLQLAKLCGFLNSLDVR